jgi:hypothetical protein
MKLRVWHIQNVPNEPIYISVKSPEEAIKVIKRRAEKDLEVPWIVSNAFGLEVHNEETSEWEEWYSEEGDDIDQYAEALENKE